MSAPGKASTRSLWGRVPGRPTTHLHHELVELQGGRRHNPGSAKVALERCPDPPRGPGEVHGGRPAGVQLGLGLADGCGTRFGGVGGRPNGSRFVLFEGAGGLGGAGAGSRGRNLRNTQESN